jgi:hypothetical protein
VFEHYIGRARGQNPSCGGSGATPSKKNLYLGKRVTYLGDFSVSFKPVK